MTILRTAFCNKKAKKAPRLEGNTTNQDDRKSSFGYILVNIIIQYKLRKFCSRNARSFLFDSLIKNIPCIIQASKTSLFCHLATKLFAGINVLSQVVQNLLVHLGRKVAKKHASNSHATRNLTDTGRQ